MKRRIIGPLLLASLVLLAGCLSAPLQTTAQTDGGIDATTISTTGTGEVTAESDLAVVNIAVTHTADSADEARGVVAEDVAAVRAALTDAGIAEDAIQSTGFHIYPEYNYGGDERELVGYRAAHSLTVEVAPDRAGEVIDLSVGAGADEIRGVFFTLTDEKRAELRSEALTKAVESAEADAETVATAADLRITGVHTANVGGGYSPGPYPVAYAEDARAGSAGAPTELTPGPVTVSATVQMVYTAE
ncbi:SIMPL domain-containing protein [Haloferax sp. YSMS24]|uniref:SIMPL domain-containing protein n=1 Tax=unclassified Haloferax TaxID=2625095 RepID=UPI00398CF0DA